MSSHWLRKWQVLPGKTHCLVEFLADLPRVPHLPFDSIFFLSSAQPKTFEGWVVNYLEALACIDQWFETSATSHQASAIVFTKA
ncbi:hypothetical protein RHSIM_Rhsim09G0117100 [Rhododendron simsii]|uniref:Uncharacterized protein n=1 Tax=Rhododendron simsii TaxID=118357 RepID=A0A834GGQ8_RHOSS|nr:hypothetical protein RHSIM_Rhsim09G0117100 [Rhododendron simsii]